MFKDKSFDNHLALQLQNELLQGELTQARQETQTLREKSEQYRKEFLIMSQSQQILAPLHIELASSRKEVRRLTQTIESLFIDLERIKKDSSPMEVKDASKVDPLCTLPYMTNSIANDGDQILSTFCPQSHSPGPHSPSLSEYSNISSPSNNSSNSNSPNIVETSGKFFSVNTSGVSEGCDDLETNGIFSASPLSSDFQPKISRDTVNSQSIIGLEKSIERFTEVCPLGLK